MEAVIQLIRKASSPSAALQSGKLCFTLTINCIRAIFKMITLEMNNIICFSSWLINQVPFGVRLLLLAKIYN